MSVSPTDAVQRTPATDVAAERRAVADDVVRDFMVSGQAETTYRVLADHYPRVDGDDVLDAVAEGVAAYYGRALEHDVADPAGYVYSTGWNQLARRARTRTVPLDEVDDVEDASSPEERQSDGRALRAVLDLVERWETGRERAIIRIVIEAAAEGIQLSANEIADLLRAQGVGDLSAATVRVHKSRGLARLRRDVVAMGVELRALEPAPEPDDEEDQS
jgi:hypothetical protein